MPVQVLPSTVASPFTFAFGACSAAAVRPLTLSENVIAKPTLWLGPSVVPSNRMSATVGGVVSTGAAVPAVTVPLPALPKASCTSARSRATALPPPSTRGVSVAVHVR